jgi:hypothetical protein
MKPLPRLLLLSWLALVPAFAADPISDTVRRADDARVTATLAADPGKLDAILSNELHYAHSSGKIDTKASYVQSLVSHNTVYETYKFVDRTFVPAGPGIVIEYGHALINSLSGGAKALHDLNFLAVWREENGVWRFMAWQSCENPPAVPAAK